MRMIKITKIRNAPIADKRTGASVINHSNYTTKDRACQSLPERKRKSDKPFAEIRALMRRYEYTQDELAQDLNRSKVYVNERMTCKKQWTLDDVYKIMELFCLDLNDMPFYFPKGGIG